MCIRDSFYTEHPELWEVDYSWEGFQWIVPDDNQQSVIAFLRRDAKGKMIMVVCNFNPIERVDYQMGVPNPGTYKEDVYKRQMVQSAPFSLWKSSILP